MFGQLIMLLLDKQSLSSIESKHSHLIQVLRHNQTRRASALNKSAILLQGAAPTVEDFDKKLAETDRYLQLLLNQVAALKDKIDDPDASPEAKAKYEDIAEKTVAMTESIKHAIVLLQIAKNATLPEQGSASVPAVRGPATASISSGHGGHVAVGSPVSRPSSQPKKDGFAALVSGQNNIETGIELGAECKEKVQPQAQPHHDNQKRRQEDQQVSPKPNSSSSSLKVLKTSAIPEFSYSSDSDDDFFDAEDDEELTTSATMATAVSSIADPVSISSCGTTKPATLDLAATSNDSFETLDNMIQSPMTPEEGKNTKYLNQKFES